MSQVVGNLLQNAVKFTPSGGSVVVSVGSKDDGAQLRVRDSGVGMKPETIEHMSRSRRPPRLLLERKAGSASAWPS
jgi:signal transduction histidine kinase